MNPILMVVAEMPGALAVFPALELVVALVLVALVLDGLPDDEVVVGDELFDELLHAVSTSAPAHSTIAAWSATRLLRVVIFFPSPVAQDLPDGESDVRCPL
jgi:hypothetical protein